uniref:Transmembrane protein n=1 Tax=Arundo donax TaxID=35708 RepID=A0A0A9G350_ARUDO
MREEKEEQEKVDKEFEEMENIGNVKSFGKPVEDSELMLMNKIKNSLRNHSKKVATATTLLYLVLVFMFSPGLSPASLDPSWK